MCRMISMRRRSRFGATPAVTSTLRAVMRALLSGALICIGVLLAASSSVHATDDTQGRVRVDEHLFRVNYQQDGVIVISETIGADRDEHELEADCNTGTFGALERWRVLLRDEHRAPLSNEPTAATTFVNLARQVKSLEPPCIHILDKLRTYLDRMTTREMKTVVVETLVEERGYFITRQPAHPRWLVRDGVSVPFVHEEDVEGNLHTDAETQARESLNLEVVESFDFVCSLDALDWMVERSSYPLLSEALRAPYLEELSSSVEDDFDGLLVDHLELLIQEERDLLQLFPAGTAASSWTRSLSLEDWELVRQKTSAQDRRALAQGWTVMGKLWLASSGNASKGMNCLRRALVWYPGLVPAYLELSSLLLNHVGNQNASCETMEVMLENVDPTEFRSGEMSTILTTNFPHCSVIIRMANLWESSTLFRYVVGSSVVISFIHGICVAMYFFHDKFHLCCFWRSQKESSSASTASSRHNNDGSSGKGGGRKSKRE